MLNLVSTSTPPGFGKCTLKPLFAPALAALCFLGSETDAALVARYTFDGNYNDVSGNGHHAAPSSGTGSITTDAVRGSVFSSTDTYLDLEDTLPLPHFAANSSITLTAWAKQTADPGSNYAYILQLGQNGDNPIASLGILPDGRFVSYSETSQPGFNTDQINSHSDGPVEDTDAWAQWHHLAAVYDRTADLVTLYVDGTVAGTNDISLLDDTYAFNWTGGRIGGDYGGAPYFQGLIDDVCIYDEALSASEIAAMVPPRILVDFGLTNETTSSPDAFGHHWNNFSVNGSALPATETLSTVISRNGATAPGVSISITNAFFRASSNSSGNEDIYVSNATGDFYYIDKGNDPSAAMIIAGLDPSGDTVYDFKFFITSNRSEPEVFITDFTAMGTVTNTASLEAVNNTNTVASINSIQPRANGEIEILIEINDASTSYGGLSVLEILGRSPSEAVTPDPQPAGARWAEFGSTPNPPATAGGANPEGLTAYVFETDDSFSGYVGAGESLRRAGFHVQPLPLDEPPFEFTDDPETDVDLILFGSFVSEDPRYQAYMAAYADILDDYVDRAGYLVQLTQADQTEPQPSFLPDTQNATREDGDFTEAVILAPTHQIIQEFPTNAAGKIAYTMPHIGTHSNDVVWEVFNAFAGFEVILSGDTRARYPALMEGAYGQGQLLLAAMAPDKILNADDGSEQSDVDYSRFNQKFFENLYIQTRNVRDREADPITITPQPGDSAIDDGAWTIALLPDTQIYSQNRPGVFSAQTVWLRDNARKYNIRYVLHLGDIVNVNSQPEWAAAREAMGVLDGHLPYAFVPGNHDYGPSGNASSRDTLMNDHFLFGDYSARPHFGGAMENGKLDNTYHLFEAGGYDWIILCLEWGPRDSTIAWADSILDAHPNRKAILVTHAYMNNNDLRYDHTDTENPQNYNPHNYSTPGGVNDGEELWQKLVKEHDFVLTVNGHVLGDGTGFRTDANNAGQNVHQMLANYQFLSPFGGNGYLRLLIINPDGTVEVKSYSPLYNNFLTETDQEFAFDFEWYAPADTNSNGQPDYFDDTLDSDGDGLSNYREFVVLGTDPFGTDSDGDGIPDEDEIAIGTNPSVSDKQINDALLNHGTRFGLYTEQEILDLNLSHLMITPDGSNFVLNLQLEYSDDLTNTPFEPVGEPVEWTLPNNGIKGFLRVRGE
ncbi:LamG-like jellyroll fold domain-containing protein [Pontiella agarivorans]|uniref:Metallophosphoesterase n=1 Tax=Pontiella agarivorans TaxID=3038953 RepID=A0ABU5N0W4_9BACT|nr:LamG-like jellyroll fold domain-containing protein [Pontiella agarivorans]MDZ8120073.1 metallophosphoesterase [Pontiella agarivorans]